MVYGINAACKERTSQLNHRFAAMQFEDVSFAHKTMVLYAVFHRFSLHVLCQQNYIWQSHRLHQLILILFVRQNGP